MFTFVSSNIQKRNQWNTVAKELNINLDIENKEFLEIQDTVQEIAMKKAHDAFEYYGKPVIVEDVSLEIKDWKNNPGPFIKYFPNDILPVGSDATFIICIAVMSQYELKHSTFKTFGKICVPVDNVDSFGFDPVFEINGINLLHIDPDSHPRYLAIKEFLLNLNK